MRERGMEVEKQRVRERNEGKRGEKREKESSP